MSLLNEIINQLNSATDEQREQALGNALEQTRGMLWVPNPGAQLEAWTSEADIIGFGGEAGPGKTDLMIGMSLQKHRRSLILRKLNKDAKSLSERYIEILGHKQGLNESTGKWRLNDKLIEFGGCEHEQDKQKYKGSPHDLIGFDEVVDFSRSQVEFIMQWNRTTVPGQKCTVVMTFNPPTTPSGLWVLEYFAAWLDPRHPNPAKSGEIRWFTTINGKDTEVDGPGPHIIEGEDKPVMAKSRTFIRGKLEENIALFESGYDATRAAAPAAMRAAYRDGDFEAALADFPGQLMPTTWVRDAQRRWTPHPPRGVPMCAMGVDASGGGRDPMVMAIRYDGWYAPMVSIDGEKLDPRRIGAMAAGLIVSYRKDDADIIVDMGGGYGGAIYEKLEENEIEVYVYKGSEKATVRTRDGKMGFVNIRSAAYWLFREALDPDQPGGSPICLPEDPELVADLTTLGFEVTPRGIQVTPKEKICEQLGRSTDKGDATVMAWWQGQRGMARLVNVGASHEHGIKKSHGRPQVVLGHPAARNKIRRR